MNVRDVSSAKDLHSVSFSDLFYEVFDSDDRENVANRIVERVEPGFSLEDRKQAEAQAGDLRACLEAIEERRDRLTDNEQFAAALMKKAYLTRDDKLALSYMLDGVLDYMVDLNPHPSPKGASFEDWINNRSEWRRKVRENPKDAEESLDIGKVVDHYLDADFEERENWLNWICFHVFDRRQQCFISMYDVARDRAVEEMQKRLDVLEMDLASQKKHLAALTLLPKLADDQDMMVFFGNNFHTTFSNVDAYSGLLYAYEYFEYVGII